MPTRARPRQLAQCLGALARLDYPRDRFEVIVVRDGGPTLPDALVSDFGERLTITWVSQASAGPAAARNTGAARARGEWLVFVDDDCAPAPDYLQRLAEAAAVAGPCALGGRTVNVLTCNRFSAASQLLIDYLYAYFGARDSRSRFFTSNNLALPRALFEEVGGFDARFRQAAAEDRELCSRLVARGYALRFEPSAMVYHFHDLALGGFLRQHFAYGRGAYHFRRIRAEIAGARVGIEPLSFYLHMLRYPFRTPEYDRPALVSALLATSQVANAAGFLWEAARARRDAAQPASSR